MFVTSLLILLTPAPATVTTAPGYIQKTASTCHKKVHPIKKYRGTVTTAPATITTAPFQSYDSIGPDNYIFI